MFDASGRAGGGANTCFEAHARWECFVGVEEGWGLI